MTSRAAMALLPPIAPDSIEATGLPPPLLRDLVLRMLAGSGATGEVRLARLLALPHAVVEALVRRARADGLVSVPALGSLGAEPMLTLTAAGRAQAEAALARCAYVGPAPVPLAQYDAVVAACSVRASVPGRAQLRAALADAVVDDGLVERIGAALAGHRPLFLWGPSGTGKSFISRRLSRAYDGAAWVPHAVAVGEDIVRVFDDRQHLALPEAGIPRGIERRAHDIDRRYVACERPAVVLGGELDVALLDAQPEPGSRCWVAPPQWKANNGVVVLDDLGRQRSTLAEIANRWFQAFDTGRDTQALGGGQRVDVPFDVVVVMSSNVSPDTLGDPAIVRRLGYKVHVDALPRAAYARLLRETAQRASVDWLDAGADHLIDSLHGGHAVPLYAAIPGDLLGRIADRARFTGEPARLSPDAVDWAWSVAMGPDERPERFTPHTPELPR